MQTRFKSYDRDDVIVYVESQESTDSGGCLAVPFGGYEAIKKQRGYYRGQVLDDFYARKRSGELLPFTFYERYDMTASQSGQATLRWKPFWCGNPTNKWTKRTATIAGADMWSPWGTKLVLNATDLYQAYDRSGIDPQALLQQAAANVFNGFDLGTFTAEIGLTLEMILSLRERALNLLTRKPKGKIPDMRDVKRISKDISNAWVEWFYGWRLLAKDCNDIAQQLSNIAPSLFRQNHVNDSHFENIQETLTMSPRANGEKYECNMVSEYSVSVRATFAGEVSLNTNVFITPITLWEIIPHSFVVDWFVNVGQAIQALMSTLVTTNHQSCYGIYVTGTIRGVVQNPTHDGSVLDGFWKGGESLCTGTLKVRQPSGVSILPRFNPYLSPGRYASAIALLLQRLT